jgi:hypothetical protein
VRRRIEWKAEVRIGADAIPGVIDVDLEDERDAQIGLFDWRNVRAAGGLGSAAACTARLYSPGTMWASVRSNRWMPPVSATPTARLMIDRKSAVIDVRIGVLPRERQLSVAGHLIQS